MDLEEVAQRASATVSECIRRTARLAPIPTALIVGRHRLDYASLDFPEFREHAMQ